jgi:hypothetical protein
MSGWLQAGTCFPRACANRLRPPARSMRIRRRCQTSLHDLSFAWVHPSRVSLLFLCRWTFATNSSYQSLPRVQLQRQLFKPYINGRREQGGHSRPKPRKRKKCLAVRRGTRQSGGEARDAFSHAQAACNQGAARLGHRHRADTARYRRAEPAGDDPVSPGGHDPARLMDLVTPPLLSPREWQSHPSAAAKGSRTVRVRAPSGAPGFHPSGPA